MHTAPGSRAGYFNSGIHEKIKPSARVGREAYRVSLRQPGRRNILSGSGDPAFFLPEKCGTGSRIRQKETVMSVFERKTIGPLRKLLLPAVSVAIFMASSAANAEQLPWSLNAANIHPVPEITLQTVKRTVDVCLNENGDLMVRRGDISLTMAYNPPEEFIEPQERIRIVQRQNCPAIVGISLKVSFMF